MNDQILIIGGGFAGFWAAIAAKRVAVSRARVTLLSREPLLQMRPRFYEANPQSLCVDLQAPLAAAGVGFVQGEACDLDTAARIVSLVSGDVLSYARLVVATGSTMRRPAVPGASDAYSVDTRDDAITFDRRLAEIARTSRHPTIAVVGAGFTGIELALELRDRIAVHRCDAEALRIVLVDRADTVGAELGPGPRPEIEAALTAARVELRLGTTVTALAANQVSFANGSALDADAVVLATGMVASDFVRHVPGERDRLGRIVVARSLKAPAAPDVFVAGDAAAADTGDGHLALQSCQHALQLGRFAGENAARDLLHQPLLSYTQQRYVTCLDLGRAGAVLTQGWDRAVRKTGADAKALKRQINTVVIYPPAKATGAQLLALSSTDPAEQSLPG
jgi:NADH:ubiquinone reductase (H+-translocating)